MDIHHDINKTIESLNFLIDEVFEKAHIEDEIELDNCFIQFNLFYTENEYFTSLINFNKKAKDNFIKTAIINIKIVYDTLKVMDKLAMEDKDKLHAFAFMSLVLCKANLYLYKRLEEGTWAVSPIT